MTVLHVDPEELVTCVACGLCLPHCPTYRVTGDESASPRGRIAAMRAVQSGDVDLRGEFTRYMDECVQCRACEVACPSSVPFGHLMEGTRQTLAAETSYVPRWQRVAYRALRHHRLLLVVSRGLAVAQRAHLVPRRVSLPRLPLHSRPLRGTGDDVWLFTGCVMDAWQRDVHAAVVRVLDAAGVGVALPDPRLAGCCGALPRPRRAPRRRRDAGPPGPRRVPRRRPDPRRLRRLWRRAPGLRPAARDRRSRHLRPPGPDVHEWLAPRLDDLPAPPVPPTRTYPSPCTIPAISATCSAPTARSGPSSSLTSCCASLDDEGLCCGAGSVYAALHPELANQIRDRKLDAIHRSGASIVASANPGCTLHLAAAGVDVRHPLELVDAALHPDPSRRG